MVKRITWLAKTTVSIPSAVLPCLFWLADLGALSRNLLENKNSMRCRTYSDLKIVVSFTMLSLYVKSSYKN